MTEPNITLTEHDNYFQAEDRYTVLSPEDA